MANTRTEPSKSKASQSDEPEIVELKPPPDLGFSGTVKLYAVEQATFIAGLMARGYTRVTP